SSQHHWPGRRVRSQRGVSGTGVVDSGAGLTGTSGAGAVGTAALVSFPGIFSGQKCSVAIIPASLWCIIVVLPALQRGPFVLMGDILPPWCSAPTRATAAGFSSLSFA